MMQRIVIVIAFLLMLSFLLLSVSYADNAEVLPKGVSRIGLDSKFYFPVDERYDPDGDTEDVAADFNTTLDSSVFPALSALDPFVPGLASIGSSVVSFEYDFNLFEFSYQYGLTDRLTVGVIIPYWKVKNNVDARLDTSTANVGKNAALNTLLPLGTPGTVPLTTEDVQNLLGAGLDINGDGAIDIQGFGYERVESWSDDGLSDIEIGARYQYLKTEDWRLAFTGGVRLPTGDTEDPDNLVDYGFGSGAYALLFRFNNDYTGIKNLVLNATFRYDLILPDEEEKRVTDEVNQVITTNKEKVDRDLGDVIELEASGTYQFSEGFGFSLLYQYGHAFEDEISGDKGFNYESLEDETDYTEHVFIAGLSYSTIPLYKEKKFRLPLIASIKYRNRFAGSNNVLKSRYIGLDLAIYF